MSALQASGNICTAWVNPEWGKEVESQIPRRPGQGRSERWVWAALLRSLVLTRRKSKTLNFSSRFLFKVKRRGAHGPQWISGARRQIWCPCNTVSVYLEEHTPLCALGRGWGPALGECGLACSIERWDRNLQAGETKDREAQKSSDLYKDWHVAVWAKGTTGSLAGRKEF